MFKTNCSSIEQRYKKHGDDFFMGTNKHTCPIFDNELLASSKQIKLCPRDYIFPIKQEDVFDYNPLYFIFIGLMLGGIIMNLFIDCTEQTTGSVKKDLSSKIQDDTIHLYKGSLQDFT